MGNLFFDVQISRLLHDGASERQLEKQALSARRLGAQDVQRSGREGWRRNRQRKVPQNPRALALRNASGLCGR